MKAEKSVFMRKPANTPSESLSRGSEKSGVGVAHNPSGSVSDDEVSLLELWIILWRSRWLIIGVTAVFAALSIPYALMQEEWFSASTLLAPAKERSTSGLTRQLGGLIGLAGVTVGGGGNVEPLAILQSRDFLASFIEEQNLLKVLFSAQWDPQTSSWLVDSPEDEPDMRDAVEYFKKNIISVGEDSVTGLVTLAVNWTDPELAAKWANLLVDRLNENLRDRELAEAEANVNYLQVELGETNIVTLQQSIGRLLEAELQKVMLARGNAEFAFRVIDRAQTPKTRFKPNRRLIVVLATFLGGMLSVLFVFTRHAFKVTRKRLTGDESG